MAALVVSVLAWLGQPAFAQSDRGHSGLLAGSGLASAATISTIVGGVGGPAKATSVAIGYSGSNTGPCSVAYGNGQLYIAAGRAVRQVDPATDLLTTSAGTGVSGTPGDGVPAGQAAVDSCAAAVDHSGNLVIADLAQDRVRVVAASSGTFYGQAMTAGDIYTVAGNGTGGYSGDGGPAITAQLRSTYGVAVDHAGNLVIADSSNARVRVVAASTGNFYGQAMTAGDIYTVAGNGTGGYSGDGGPAVTAGLAAPNGVAVDGAGNLVIAASSNRVRVVAASTGTFYGQAMTAGDIYTVAGDGAVSYSGDGGPATSAELGSPDGLVLDHAGNLVFSDQGNSVVRVVAAATGTFYGQAMTAGDIYTVAGDGTAAAGSDGGPATGTQLWLPMGLAVDSAGNLLIADSGSDRVRVVAASSGTFYGQAMIAGHIYTAVGDGIRGSAGNGGPAAKAELNQPADVTIDHAGNLVIAEWGNNWVRVVAASSGTFYGQAMTAGDIYTVAGDGSAGYSGDKGPAAQAMLTGPSGVTVDGAGNLVIADWYNNRVRVVAVRTGTFYGQAMTAGDIYTIVGNGAGGYSGDGGPATSAAVSPESVTLDAAGNLVVADTFNNRVRVVAATNGTFYGQAMTAGDIYSVAGTGTSGFAGDGGPPLGAELSRPAGVLVTSAGNLLIADQNNNRLRMLTS